MWYATSLKLECRKGNLPGAAHAKIVMQYVEEFCDNGVRRMFTEAPWARYKVGGTNSETVPFLSEQFAILQKLHNDRVGCTSDRINGEEISWGFEGTVTAKLVATPGIYGEF